MKHPTDRIRAQVWFITVGLALLVFDLWEIRKLAAEARDIERELRLRKARDENELFDIHEARVAELQAEIAALRANGFRAAESKPVEAEAEAEPVDAEPVEADEADEG